MKNIEFAYNDLDIIQDDYDISLRHISVIDSKIRTNHQVLGNQCCEIYFIINGQCDYVSNEYNDTLKKNDLLFVNGRNSIASIYATTQKLKYVALGIGGILVSESEYEESTEHIHRQLNFRDSKVHMFFNELIEESENQEFNYLVVSKYMVKSILSHIERCEIAHFYPISDFKQHNELIKVKEYIDSNYRSDILLQDLAEMAFMSKYYLVHRFTSLFGVSPINYVLEKRVDGAKKMLNMYPKKKLSEVAKESGFRSQSYFNQVFKRRVGITPTNYKRIYNKIPLS